MSSEDRALDTLLQSLRACHDPAPADQERVRTGLDAAVMNPAEQVFRLEQEESFDTEEPSGVHSRPRRERLDGLPQGGPAWPVRVGPSHLLVGAIALAAAAAVAVAALAKPAAFGAMLLASGNVDPKTETASTEGSDPPRALARDEIRAEPPVLTRKRASRLLGNVEASSSDEPSPLGCERWPCLTDAPAPTFTLGGAQLSAGSPSDSGEAREGHAPQVLRDRMTLPEVSPSPRVEVAPTVALELTPGRTAVGAGVRVSVPVTKNRTLAVQATAHRFEEGRSETEDFGALWSFGTGICWQPVTGKLDVALCGTLGYERQRAELDAEEVSRLTAGATAQAVWKFTRATSAYLAVQTATPVLGDRPSDRALVMRLVAGPQFSF